MKDTHLLPYILPNVSSIAAIVTPQQFTSLVLPSLKPLFTITEPPQNMLTLLDNLTTLQEKTEKAVFRERASEPPPLRVTHVLTCTPDVLPLVYNALESEHAPVRFEYRPFLLELYLLSSRYKNVLSVLCLVYVRVLIMPKSKAFSFRGLRCDFPFPYCSHDCLTDDTTARLHENAHSVRESSYSGHVLEYGQNT